MLRLLYGPLVRLGRIVAADQSQGPQPIMWRARLVEGAFGSGQRGGGLQLGLALLLVAAQLAVQSSLPPASPNGPPPAHRCFRCKQVEERVQGFPPDFPQVAFLKVDLEETEVGRDA